MSRKVIISSSSRLVHGRIAVPRHEFSHDVNCSHKGWEIKSGAGEGATLDCALSVLGFEFARLNWGSIRRNLSAATWMLDKRQPCESCSMSERV